MSRQRRHQAEAQGMSRHTTRPAARPDWRPMWESRKAAWVEAAWVAMMRDPFTRRFFYYVPTDGRAWGQLLTVADGAEPPPGAVLAVAAPVPPGEKARLRHWLETDGQVNWLSVIPKEL